MQTVVLNENAFISMVAAAVETFPDETLGALLGLRKTGTILVQYAVPYQTAKRARTHVSIEPLRGSRVQRFLGNTTRLEVVGDFHSHPGVAVTGKGYKLSEADKRSTPLKRLGTVIVVDEDKKRREWKHLPKGSLLGSVHPYSIRITSWFKRGATEFEIAEIHCPFAVGLLR